MDAPPWDQLLDIVPDLSTSCTHEKQVYISKEFLLPDSNRRGKDKEQEKGQGRGIYPLT